MGLLFALISAAAFGLSGSMARSLLDLGWSPAAVVAIRMGGAPSGPPGPCAGVPAADPPAHRRQSARVIGYGLTAVADGQLASSAPSSTSRSAWPCCWKYLAPVPADRLPLAAQPAPPAYSVLVGAAIALIGLVFMLDLRGGLTLNPIGVLGARRGHRPGLVLRAQ